VHEAVGCGERDSRAGLHLLATVDQHATEALIRRSQGAAADAERRPGWADGACEGDTALTCGADDRARRRRDGDSAVPAGGEGVGGGRTEAGDDLALDGPTPSGAVGWGGGERRDQQA
jgi:hypothetical protein